MKKFATMAISVALIGTMIAGGSLAYLQDSDSDVNVMTLGSVKIEQHEYQREKNSEGKYVITHFGTEKSYVLEAFEQGKPLLPTTEIDGNGNPINHGAGGWDETTVSLSQIDSSSTHKQTVFKSENAVDKFVFVKNTGNTNAYVRTLIAFERGNVNTDQIGFSHSNSWTAPIDAAEMILGVEIDGNKYDVLPMTYEEEVPGGEFADGCPLAQVYLMSSADNDYCDKLDGNKNGTYDILVLSQAVQAQGFADAKTALKAAFGEANAANVQAWFSGEEFTAPTAVATADELTAALANGESVYLTEDVTVTATMNVAAGKDVVINLNGNDISYAVSNSGASAIINNKGTLDIVGEGTISFVADNPDLGEIPSYATNTITNTGTLTIGEGVTVTNGSDGGASYAVDNHGKFTLNGGTLNATRTALRVAKYNSPEVEFVMNSGTIKGSTPVWIQLPGDDSSVAPKISVTVNDGLVETTKQASEDNNIFYTYSYGNSHANTSITINGGEFLGGTVSIGSGYKGDVPTLKINGGTFEYDVLQWLQNDTSEVLFTANK